MRVEFAYETGPAVEDEPAAAPVPLQVVNQGGYVDGGYMDSYVASTLDPSDSHDSQESHGSNGSRAWS